MKLSVDIDDNLYDLVKFAADECNLTIDESVNFHICEGLEHIAECGPDIEDDDADIDENIIGAIDFINDFPTLITVISCGGHEFPTDCSQSPLNEWYINFIVQDPETREEIDDLEDVKNLTGFVSELEFGYDEWIRVECHMTVMGDFYYTLRGHNCDPEEYFPWVCDDCKCEMCAGVEA